MGSEAYQEGNVLVLIEVPAETVRTSDAITTKLSVDETRHETMAEALEYASDYAATCYLVGTRIVIEVQG